MPQFSLLVSDEMKAKIKFKAEVTVFFSLILCTVMAFVVIIAKHSLLSYVKIKAEAITDSSVKSAFSEYSQEIFDKYRLLCIDTTYKGKTGGVNLLGRHIKEYAEESFAGDKDKLFMHISDTECEITKYMLLSDFDAQPFIIQACMYANKNIQDRYAIDTNEYNGNVDVFMDEILNQIFLSSRTVQSINIQSDSMRSTGNFSESIFKNEMIFHDIKYNDLKANDIKKYLSLYALDMFSSYANKKEKSYLNYEAEYILFGNKKDYENMEEMIEKMLRIQLTINNYDKYLDKLYEIYSKFEYENYDSFDDYFLDEIDFKNDSLPYVKSINNVLMCLTENEDKNGLHYEDYLYTFLKKKSPKVIAKRMLDLIEINLRSFENVNFRVDKLIVYASVKNTFYTSESKTYYKQSEYGYFKRY